MMSLVVNSYAVGRRHITSCVQKFIFLAYNILYCWSAGPPQHGRAPQHCCICYHGSYATDTKSSLAVYEVFLLRLIDIIIRPKTAVPKLFLDGDHVDDWSI